MIERMLGKASRAQKKTNEVEVVINLLSGSSRKNNPHKYTRNRLVWYVERLIPLLVTRLRQITALRLPSVTFRAHFRHDFDHYYRRSVTRYLKTPLGLCEFEPPGLWRVLLYKIGGEEWR